MSFANHAMYIGVIYGTITPDAVAYAKGRTDRDNNLGFHENPYTPDQEYEGISWRVGWNARALELN